MTTTTTTTRQRTLDHDRQQPRASTAAQRTIARERAQASIDAAADPATEAAQREQRRIGALLIRYINTLHGDDNRATGKAEFQACDFTNWLGRSGQRPAPGTFDLRGCGSMFKRLVETGALAIKGARTNAGDPIGNSHGTIRVVYERQREAWLFDLGLQTSRDASAAGGTEAIRGVFAPASPVHHGLFGDDDAPQDYSGYAEGAA